MIDRAKQKVVDGWVWTKQKVNGAWVWVKTNTRELLVITGVVTMTFAAGAPGEELTFVMAGNYITFDTVTEELDVNTYAHDDRFDVYYVHFANGDQYTLPSDWDFQSRTYGEWDIENSQERMVTYVNPVPLTEVQIKEIKYKGYYKDSTGKTYPEVFKKKEYDDLKIKDKKPKKKMSYGFSFIDKAFAGTTLDSATTSISAGWATEITISHTITGTDVALGVLTAIKHNSDIFNGVAWNGTQMASSTSVTNSSWITIDDWILINPDTGTHNLVASTSAGQIDHVTTIMSVTGADQTTQPDDVATYEGYPNSATDFTVSLTTTRDGEHGIDVVQTSDTTGSQSSTGGQTNLTLNELMNSSFGGGGYEVQATAGTLAMSYQYDVAFKGQALMGLAFLAAEAAPAGDNSATTTINYGRVHLNNGRLRINNPN